MINTNTSTVRITADTTQFNSAMTKAEANSKTLSAGFGRLSAGAISLAGSLAAAAGIGGIGVMVQRSLKLQDEQAKLADRLGITTQALSAFHLQADLSGVGADAFDNAIQKMVVNLQDAAEGTGEAGDAVKKLGLDIFDLASKSPDQAYLQIASAMGGMTSESEKLSIATDIFGMRATAMVNMINEGRDGFDAAALKVAEYGTAISRVDAAKIEAANDAMRLVSESTDGLATRITVRLSPALVQMSENWARNTTAMAKFFGLRTEGEELNHLLEKRAGIMEQIRLQEDRGAGNADGTKVLRMQADAMRDEINVMLDKQATEARGFIERDKIKNAEQAANKQKLQQEAIDKQLAADKKTRIAEEIQGMKDQAQWQKDLYAEMMEEQNANDMAEQLLRDQRVAGKIDYQNNLREINQLEIDGAREKAGYIMEIEEQQHADQIARGEAAFSTMLGNVASHNKTFFKIQKIYRLSKLAMEAPAAIADSYAWGASWGGPPAGGLMAGIAAAAMGAYASQLMSASYGGGAASGGASAAGGSANPVTSPIVPGATSVVNPPQSSGSVQVIIQGNVIGEDSYVMNTLVPAIQDAVQNRDVILISNNSRNAQQLIPA